MPIKYVMPDGRTVNRDAPEAVEDRLQRLERSFYGLLWLMVRQGRMTEEQVETVFNEPEEFDPSKG